MHSRMTKYPFIFMNLELYIYIKKKLKIKKTLDFFLRN